MTYRQWRVPFDERITTVQVGPKHGAAVANLRSPGPWVPAGSETAATIDWFLGKRERESRDQINGEDQVGEDWED